MRYLTPAILAVLLALNVGQAIYIFNTHEEEVRPETAREAASSYVGQVTDRSLDEARAVLSDLRELRQAIGDEVATVESDPDSRDSVERALLDMLSARDSYDQVRILDWNGIEVARADRSTGWPSVVPAERLQDKSDRYYYGDVMAIGPGRYYVSPVDLNEEFGQVETGPAKIMMRFAYSEVPEGAEGPFVYLINVYADRMIQVLEEELHGLPGAVYVAERDGLWIGGSEDDIPDGISEFRSDEGSDWTEIDGRLVVRRERPPIPYEFEGAQVEYFGQDWEYFVSVSATALLCSR